MMIRRKEENWKKQRICCLDRAQKNFAEAYDERTEGKKRYRIN